MKCEEAAEFVSALCDGERIPREAAEHIGVCDPCSARLKEYTELSAELRRVASLESAEEPRVRRWGKDQRIPSSWWRKGRETMRIPRFAFALLLIAVVVLGSSLAIVSARAHTQGPVLMLTAKAADGNIVRCALSLEDKRYASVNAVQKAKKGVNLYEFRVISKDGDRIELGVRAKFSPQVSAPFTADSDKTESLPETRHWFQPGEELKIEIAGFGAMVITGKLLDHMPSLSFSDDEQLDPNADELRMVSPVLLRGKEVLLDFGGTSVICDNRFDGIEIYAPGNGLYDLSLSPLEGAVEGKINLNRISFELNGQSYIFLTGMPVAREKHIWILHDANYKPPDQLQRHGFASEVDMSHRLVKPPAKN
jgi:hypothetical protein